MNKKIALRVLCISVPLWLAYGDTSAQSGGAWPQWRGPNRDGVAASAVASWPATLTQKWKVPAGSGYSAPIVAAGRVFVHARADQHETVTALDALTGRALWQDSYAAPYTVNPAAASHGPGPKSTPAYANLRLFTYGISGILSCFDAASGKVVWRTQPLPGVPDFGTATSPIVFDGTVVVFAGNAQVGALVALDASTGAVRWKAAAGSPAYASPVIATLAGVRQLVTQSRSHVEGIAVKDGRLIWQVPLTTAFDQNSVTPLIVDDVVIYSGLENGTSAVRIATRGAGVVAETVWKNTDVSMYMSTPVQAGGAILGMSHRNRGQFFALDAKTGKTLWTTRGREADNAALIRVPGYTLIQTTGGQLIVARDSATAFDVVRRYDVSDSATWAHPALVGNQLFVRDANSVALWII
jgi:outer membrane protein assembly factor BamB